MSDEAVTKQIQGVCDEISEKNGWTQFSVNVGSQYPVRLSTKVQAVIDQARAAGQEQAVWTFKESQGKENPNKPGTFYVNRYLSGVEPGGTIQQNATSSPGARGTSTPDETRGSIERQTIVKAAITLYPDGLILTDGDFFSLLARLAEFCAGIDATPPADDEDIPF